MMNKSIKEIYFDEPLLRMNEAERFLMRFFTYSLYGIAVAFVAATTMSDVLWLNSIGWILILFLGDRLLHYKKADKNFSQKFNNKVNAAQYISPNALAILEHGLRRANHFSKNPYLFVLHRLAQRRDIRAVLIRIDVKPDELVQKLEECLSRESESLTKELVYEKIAKLAVESFNIAQKLKSFDVEPKDLLAALGSIEDPELQTIFEVFGINGADLENAVIFSRTADFFKKIRLTSQTVSGMAYAPFKVRHRTMNRAWTAKPTPTLDQFGKDLTDLARIEEVGFLVGHNNEFERMVDVLGRSTNANVLLVGEAGIGKEAIVAHLAFQLVKDQVSEALFDKRLVELQLGALVAGAETAELRRRVQMIVDEVASTKNVILYIPEIHNLIKTGGGGVFGAADILISAIQNGLFSVIGATYPREFKEYIESRSDFLGVFDEIRVQEIGEDEAMRLLVYESMVLEREHKITISFGAVKKAVSVAHKYFRQMLLPGSAEELLKEAVSDAVQKEDKVLNASHVIAIAERKVNVPIHQAGEDESRQLLNLESLIHENLVDQEEAVIAVSRAMREYRAGLSRKGGPIASFLFVGPTGVGKTELSKILAKIQYGSKEAMVRLDMSEFQEKNSIARLIGTTDGKTGGVLTDAVLEKPFSLILLDEFEKAHPDILNVFLQVLDDGRLTDALGRTVDFQNAIIIATSNAHSDFIKTSLEAGAGMAQISEELKKKLTTYFKPELLNRFSGIIVFKTLLPEHILKIAELQLREVTDTVRESQGIDLRFDESAVLEIARLGYDPVFGARPLRAVISDKIKSVLAEEILKGEIGRGQAINVLFKEGAFVFA